MKIFIALQSREPELWRGPATLVRSCRSAATPIGCADGTRTACQGEGEDEAWWLVVNEGVTGIVVPVAGSRDVFKRLNLVSGKSLVRPGTMDDTPNKTETPFTEG